MSPISHARRRCSRRRMHSIAQFASHNAFTIAAIRTLAGDARYEFQCLHGMGESIYDQLAAEGRLDRACRIYAPVGSHETLLAYLVRRLLENGANTSFVNRIVDPAIPIASLVEDPVAVVERAGAMPHANLPLPAAMLPDRRNSSGLDLTDDAVLHVLARELAATPKQYEAAPLLASTAGGAAAVTIVNPADRDDVVGRVVTTTTEDVGRAITAALDDGAAWSRLPLAERAACLLRAADLLEARRARFIALAVREAGKTFANASAEVREAVDFLRYYAVEARGLEGAAPVGPIVAISPWNFPLAIFTGQVAAALAAGNPVLAKPAEQTPLIAHAAVQALHEAGVPRAALQLLPGAGETIGAALVGEPRIAGVLFTGSTDVARAIHRQLARARRRPRADRRNRRPERDDRRLLGAAGAGRVRRARLGLRQRRPALLGAARALPAGRHRRSRARDARGGDGGAGARRPAAPRDRRRPGDRRRRARGARRHIATHARARRPGVRAAAARGMRARHVRRADADRAAVARRRGRAQARGVRTGAARRPLAPRRARPRSSMRSTRPATASRSASIRASTRPSPRSSRACAPATST